VSQQFSRAAYPDLLKGVTQELNLLIKKQQSETLILPVTPEH
jgi:hypothetical protein